MLGRAGIADRSPGGRLPGDSSIGCRTVGNIIAAAGKTRRIVAGLTVDVEYAGVIIAGFVYGKLDKSIGNNCSLRDIEVVKPHSYNLIASIVNQFQVAAGQSNGAAAFFLRIIAAAVDPAAGLDASRRNVDGRRSSIVVVIVSSPGLDGVISRARNLPINGVGGRIIHSYCGAVDQKNNFCNGSVAVGSQCLQRQQLGGAVVSPVGRSADRDGRRVSNRGGLLHGEVVQNGSVGADEPKVELRPGYFERQRAKRGTAVIHGRVVQATPGGLA